MNFFESYSQKLADNDIINSEDKEIYSYGFKQGVILLVNVLTTLAIGLLFGMLKESIILIASYIPIRIFSGGYHSRTQTACYIVSVLITIAQLLLIKNININFYISLTLSLVFGLIIFIFAPVEDENKPLDDIEVAVYKKRSRIILLFELAIMYFLMFLKITNISNCILVSLGLMSLMLILGKIKNSFSKVTSN